MQKSISSERRLGASNHSAVPVSAPPVMMCHVASRPNTLRKEQRHASMMVMYEVRNRAERPTEKDVLCRNSTGSSTALWGSVSV